MNKKVLFIGGSSYSGSTMLDMMLSNMEQGFSVGEVHALFRPYRPHHFKPRCGCGNEHCDIWRLIKKNGEELLYKTVFDEFTEVKYIVDSSKNPYWIKSQINNCKKQGYDVYNILAWKDPVDFCESMLKRNRNGSIKAWKNYYRLYLSLIDDWISLSYEDLARTPSITLSELCKRTGIVYHNTMEMYWLKQHHTLFGNDSAKIHLYSSKNQLAIEDAVYSSVLSENNKNSSGQPHQAVYYKKTRDYVTEILEEEIINDDNIKSLLNMIASDKQDGMIDNILYDKLTLSLLSAKDKIKTQLGGVIGKYYRFF